MKKIPVQVCILAAKFFVFQYVIFLFHAAPRVSSLCMAIAFSAFAYITYYFTALEGPTSFKTLFRGNVKYPFAVFYGKDKSEFWDKMRSAKERSTL